MFGFLKKKSNEVYIGAPAKGKLVPLSQVPDPTFGDEILGKGAAVIPAEGKIYSPVDGTVAMLFDTLHAVSITSAEGAEVLVHIGLDTVTLKGEHFEAHVKGGDTVKKGDLLITVDLDAVKAAGFEIITPVIVCNTDDFGAVEGLGTKDVAPGEDIISIKTK